MKLYSLLMFTQLHHGFIKGYHIQHSLHHTTLKPPTTALLCSPKTVDTTQYIIDKVSSKELIVTKSRFIATLYPCTTYEEASHFIEANKDPKASHNCWAFRSRDNYERFSDDGEPSGTAGKPMALALANENVVDATVLVTRYYGGVKLGTGGLARAYSRAVRDVLRDAVKLPLVDRLVARCVFDVSVTGQVYRAALSVDGVVRGAEEYDGSVAVVCFSMPVDVLQEFTGRVNEMSRGAVAVQVVQ